MPTNPEPITPRIIPDLIIPNEHVWDACYYLDVTDRLIKEAEENRRKYSSCRAVRIFALEEIMGAFELCLCNLKGDINGFTDEQRKQFFTKKLRVNNKLKNIQKKHLKMFIRETKKNLVVNMNGQEELKTKIIRQ